jgi:hypothetical protein
MNMNAPYAAISDVLNAKRLNWEEGNLKDFEKYYRRHLMHKHPEFFHEPHRLADNDPNRDLKTLGWRFINWIRPRPTMEEFKKVLCKA